MPSLTIIGAGQVGKALGFLFVQKLGFTLQAVLNRSLESSQKAAEFILEETSIPSNVAITDYSALPPTDLYLITVPDQHIAAAATALAKAHCLRSGDRVIHCSGALPADILDPVLSQGAKIASMHLAKSFIDPALSVQTFAGTYCAFEGDKPGCEEISALLKTLDAISFIIEKEKKLLYHTALVIACGHLVSLTEIAIQTFEHAGIDRTLAMQILEPLMQNTLRQIVLKGTNQALTGPIARGDLNMAKKQHAALEKIDGKIAAIYDALGEVALKLAKKSP